MDETPSQLLTPCHPPLNLRCLFSCTIDQIPMCRTHRLRSLHLTSTTWVRREYPWHPWNFADLQKIKKTAKFHVFSLRVDLFTHRPDSSPYPFWRSLVSPRTGDLFDPLVVLPPRRKFYPVDTTGVCGSQVLRLGENVEVASSLTASCHINAGITSPPCHSQKYINGLLG